MNKVKKTKSMELAIRKLNFKLGQIDARLMKLEPVEKIKIPVPEELMGYDKEWGFLLKNVFGDVGSCIYFNQETQTMNQDYDMGIIATDKVNMVDISRDDLMREINAGHQVVFLVSDREDFSDTQLNNLKYVYGVKDGWYTVFAKGLIEEVKEFSACYIDLSNYEYFKIAVIDEEN